MSQETKKFKMSEFYVGKTNKEQRLELSDEIATCYRVIEHVKDISIDSAKGCLSAVSKESIVSKIQIFPDISEKFYHNVRKAIMEFKTDLQEAKKQVEDEALE